MARLALPLALVALLLVACGKEPTPSSAPDGRSTTTAEAARPAASAPLTRFVTRTDNPVTLGKVGLAINQGVVCKDFALAYETGGKTAPCFEREGVYPIVQVGADGGFRPSGRLRACWASLDLPKRIRVPDRTLVRYERASVYRNGTDIVVYGYEAGNRACTPYAVSAQAAMRLPDPPAPQFELRRDDDGGITVVTP